jgi:hypothetical protein
VWRCKDAPGASKVQVLCNGIIAGMRVHECGENLKECAAALRRELPTCGGLHNAAHARPHIRVAVAVVMHTGSTTAHTQTELKSCMAWCWHSVQQRIGV